METDKLERLLDRFARAARRHHEALEAMEEGEANRQAHLLARLAAGIGDAGSAGVAGLVALTCVPDPSVAGMAAVYLLPRDPETALRVLRRVAREPGLLGFRAGVAVERWEKGEWW
jgi:hypothetical protein